MTEKTTAPIRSAMRNPRSGLAAVCVGLITAANWCHPPLPDIKIWPSHDDRVATTTEVDGS